MVDQMTSFEVVCLHYQNPVGFERKDDYIALSSWHLFLENGVWELWVLYSAANDPLPQMIPRPFKWSPNWTENDPEP